jgi:hypothetical protein
MNDILDEAARRAHQAHLERVERALIFNDKVWAREPITGTVIIYAIPPWHKRPLDRLRIARLRRQYRKSQRPAP